MANFEQALERTLKFEGGYSNNPNDAGGETFRGISREYWPNWEGWNIIDSFPNKKALPPSQFFLGENEYDKDELSRLVSDFYHLNFWTPLHGDEIKSQEIANYLFDFAVNSGIGDAVKALQKAINKIHTPKIGVDKIIGRETLSALKTINTVSGQNPAYNKRLLSEFKDLRRKHIEKNVRNGKIHPSFAKGLAERAMKA